MLKLLEYLNKNLGESYKKFTNGSYDSKKNMSRKHFCSNYT